MQFAKNIDLYTKEPAKFLRADASTMTQLMNAINYKIQTFGKIAKQEAGKTGQVLSVGAEPPPDYCQGTNGKVVI
ncbi:MAG: hypothetical protein KDK37_06410 [Leptospiraceae bacterium]|nr:hypothetical protein [Leptospiraceae bacterium]